MDSAGDWLPLMESLMYPKTADDVLCTYSTYILHIHYFCYTGNPQDSVIAKLVLSLLQLSKNAVHLDNGKDVLGKWLVIISTEILFLYVFFFFY